MGPSYLLVVPPLTHHQASLHCCRPLSLSLRASNTVVAAGINGGNSMPDSIPILSRDLTLPHLTLSAEQGQHFSNVTDQHFPLQSVKTDIGRGWWSFWGFGGPGELAERPVWLQIGPLGALDTPREASSGPSRGDPRSSGPCRSPSPSPPWLAAAR